MSIYGGTLFFRGSHVTLPPMLKQAAAAAAFLFVAPIVGAETASRLYPWPDGLAVEVGTALMLENLDLARPSIVRLQTGVANDVGLRNGEHLERLRKGEPFSGFWDVDGASDEAPAVFSIKGPANVRIQPEGRIIGSWPHGEPVRLLRSKGEWRLVSNRARIYGWTHARNLGAVPQERILLDESTALAKALPESALQWQELRAKIAAAKALINEGACPEEPTEAETDLIGPDLRIEEIENEAISPRVLTAVRLEAFRKCRAGAESPAPKSLSKSFPKMGAEECECFRAEIGGSWTEKVSPEAWEARSKDRCAALQFHFKCFQEASEEGESPDYLACPKSCFNL